MSLTQVYQPVASRDLLRRRAFALDTTISALTSSGKTDPQKSKARYAVIRYEVYLHAILHGGSETFKTKMDKHKILGYNLSARAREIESIRFFRPA